MTEEWQFTAWGSFASLVCHVNACVHIISMRCDVSYHVYHVGLHDRSQWNRGVPFGWQLISYETNIGAERGTEAWALQVVQEHAAKNGRDPNVSANLNWDIPDDIMANSYLLTGVRRIAAFSHEEPV